MSGDAGGQGKGPEAASDAAQPGVQKAMDVAVAEFNALRAEILARTSAQATFASLGLTSTGVLLGFAFSGGGEPRILLAVPFVAAATILAYAGEASAIHRLGWYIEHDLWSFMQQCAGLELPSWERYKSEGRIPLGRRIVSGGAPIGVLLYLVGLLSALLVPEVDWWLRLVAAAVPSLAAGAAVYVAAVHRWAQKKRDRNDTAGVRRE